MNVHESEKIAGILEKMGYVDCPDDCNADVIVFNTCCIRDTAERRALGNIGVTKAEKKRNPNLVLAVVGCMPQQDGVKENIKERFPYVDIVLGTRNISALENEIKKVVEGREKIKKRSDKKYRCFDVEQPADYLDIDENTPQTRTSFPNAWVNIIYGCNNFCTYCIVPYVRGREVSRDMQNVLDEVKKCVDEGYKEITLLGQNVNSYRYQYTDGRTVDFASLLAMVADAAAPMRVRFTTSHPKDMSDEIIATIASRQNICNHIHLPVQSGSNSVLKDMNRKYTREWYLDRIAAIRKAIPDCGISTDMFTGFHNESEEDFEQTLSLMRQVGFDSSFMFKYSERPGTLASKTMPDNVPEEVKIDRLNRMIALQNQLSLESNLRDVGKTFEVLTEGRSKRSADDLFGRTQQNKVIVFPANGHHAGEFIKVKVNSASSATLIGEIAE